MKFFCKLKPSTKEILQVRVIGDDVAGEDMSVQGEQHCANTYGGEWKQCSKDGSFRKWYPGIGWFYRDDLDAFVAPQPYPSWTLNTTTCVWDPPTPKPFDSNNTLDYTWNEDTQSWDQLTVEISDPE